VDPLAHKYPRFSPYVFTGNNPVNLVDPDGRWVPGLDDDGNLTLTAEKGDNQETLKAFFNDEDAYNEYVSKADRSDDREFKKGESITLNDNVYSETIRAGDGTYDCKEFCLKTLIEGEAITDGKSEFSEDGGWSPEDLAEWGKRYTKGRTEISEEEAKPLQSMAEWSWPFDNHAAVYFGKDNSGNRYFITKNGDGSNTPTVMSYDQLDKIYNFAWLLSPSYYKPK